MEDLSARLLLESDQYAETLFWNNEYNHGDDSASDVSSGYESTRLSLASDLTSYLSTDSRDSFQQPIRLREEPEVMKFQSVQHLCENLKLILSMPELCDVTFLVGPDQIPVHGVRAILGTRSSKFYELILKHIAMNNNDKRTTKKCCEKPVGLSHSMSNRLVIPVKKYDEEVFRNLIQFVHCGSVNVTEETVVGLYCGACQFELRDLAKACLDFVERRLQAGNYEQLLLSTRNYSQHSATKTLFDKIYTVLDGRRKKYKEISV